MKAHSIPKPVFTGQAAESLLVRADYWPYLVSRIGQCLCLACTSESRFRDVCVSSVQAEADGQFHLINMGRRFCLRRAGETTWRKKSVVGAPGQRVQVWKGEILLPQRWFAE